MRTLSDLSIINALELSSPTPEQPCLDVPLSDDIIPFGPIMRARDSWDQADMAMHRCDLLSDRGRIRQKCLAHVGRNQAWRILTSNLPSFLTFLKDHRLSLVRGVPDCGLLQSCGGDIHHVEQCDKLLIISDKGSYFVLDLSQVSDAWGIARGEDYWIERYAQSDGIQWVLCMNPSVCDHQWRNFLTALPSVPRAL